jgi:DNA (cytosine-5)-methyltransferase 1
MFNHKFTFVDLFAGIGGFHKALSSNGGKCVAFSEVSKDAIDCYCKNNLEQENSNLGDIKNIKKLPPHDLLTAGVPCQSWSIAGRNLGFNDDRGQLWNDTIYLLNQSRPKAFIFENVKGLVDPRNSAALGYIMGLIKDAGYHANYYLINSYDYGVLQNRMRIYIVGFEKRTFADRFRLPTPEAKHLCLGQLFGISDKISNYENSERDLFGSPIQSKKMSLSITGGRNDYFLFNDIRNGDTTIHSWDLLATTKREKEICLLILRNRRKRIYGCLDGNPLSISQMQKLDCKILQVEIDRLIAKGILSPEEYRFQVNKTLTSLSDSENEVVSLAKQGILILDELKANRKIQLKKISIAETINSLKNKKIIECTEIRYDFKNTKISTGLSGVNRIFLPSSLVFSTLVASDANDMIATTCMPASNSKEYRKIFIESIYKKKCFRKISKSEACLLQGFPAEYILPDARSRWMKLIGNSVSVPVIKAICSSIINTGVFDN